MVALSFLFFCPHVGGGVLGVCAESVLVCSGGGAVAGGRNYLDMSFVQIKHCN